MKAAGARAASTAASNGCHRPRHESGMSQEAHVRRSGGDGRAAEDEEGDERRHPQHPSKGLSARAATSCFIPQPSLAWPAPSPGENGQKKAQHKCSQALLRVNVGVKMPLFWEEDRDQQFQA